MPKPIYEGERYDRTGPVGERILCRVCARLATHSAQRDIVRVAHEVYYCDAHLNEAIKHNERGSLYGIRILPAYRLHLHHLRKWSSQAASGDQGVLL